MQKHIQVVKSGSIDAARNLIATALKDVLVSDAYTVEEHTLANEILSVLGRDQVEIRDLATAEADVKSVYYTAQSANPVIKGIKFYLDEIEGSVIDVRYFDAAGDEVGLGLSHDSDFARSFIYDRKKHINFSTDKNFVAFAEV